MTKKANKKSKKKREREKEKQNKQTNKIIEHRGGDIFFAFFFVCF